MCEVARLQNLCWEGLREVLDFFIKFAAVLFGMCVHVVSKNVMLDLLFKKKLKCSIYIWKREDVKFGGFR